MKQIIMVVDVSGEVKIETEGYSGPLCKEESEFLKKALGEEIKDTLKPCYYSESGNTALSRRTIKPLCG